jgi:hypothetical protein
METNARWLIAGAAALWLSAAHASAAEHCRFAGTTDYHGHVAITTDASTMEGVTRVDVVVRFEAISDFWLPIQYLTEEISTWRGGVLQNVAVNYRYLVAGHVIRQNWDDFERGPDGMLARRVQDKSLGEFRVKHPGFAQHWDPGDFGRPWLQDYASAPPERRADLDLRRASSPPGLRSPFALAFFWVRYLLPGGADVPVFLPGFKADKVAVLPIRPVTSAEGRQWQAPLRYPALSETPVSSATARVSEDGHLLALAFELHGSRGSARGSIRAAGCEGAPVQK